MGGKIGMRGCKSESLIIITAGVDIDGDPGHATIPSPEEIALEKLRAELRLEYYNRDEKRRELKFLMNGGNPRDFKYRKADAILVKSTSPR